MSGVAETPPTPDLCGEEWQPRQFAAAFFWAGLIEPIGHVYTGPKIVDLRIWLNHGCITRQEQSLQRIVRRLVGEIAMQVMQVRQLPPHVLNAMEHLRDFNTTSFQVLFESQMLLLKLRQTTSRRCTAIWLEPADHHVLGNPQ